MWFLFCSRVRSINCIDENIASGRSSYSIATIADVSDCYFRRSSSFGGNGGVIYFASSTVTMRLKQCVFYYCKVSGSNNGGAIYYDDTTSGGCEINTTCASYCSSDGNHGEFAWIRTSVSKNNYFLYSTLTQCANTQIGYCPVYSHFGYQCTKNNNASYNYVMSHAGLHFVSPTTLDFAFCIVAHNRPKNYNAFGFYYIGGTISKTFIINNTSPSGGGGFLILYSPYTIDQCIFYDNQNLLLETSGGGSMIITNCQIYHTQTIAAGSVTFSTGYTSSQATTYYIDFLSTHLCQRENTSTITPAVTPQSTPMTTFEQNTPKSTPYRSFEEIVSPAQSLPPNPTPPQSLPPDPTPPQSLPPNPTPFRSFPECLDGRTPQQSSMETKYISQDSDNQNNTIVVGSISFTLSLLFFVCIQMICSVSTKKSTTLSPESSIENEEPDLAIRKHEMPPSSPYVF